jgi:hypothetical protein
MNDITNDEIDDYLNDQFEQSALEFDEERYFEEAEAFVLPEESSEKQNAAVSSNRQTATNLSVQDDASEGYSIQESRTQQIDIIQRTNDLYTFER